LQQKNELMQQIIECVPNFSEGNDAGIIKQITNEIESVEGVKLLDVDPGKATNRTVVTFVGDPESVSEAAFRAIRKASELIDMSKHRGEHPRMGATDVCPFIPVSNISMEETAAYSQKLAERVGRELHIPVYLYESAQQDAGRKNLSVIRSGEYEGFFKKILLPEWKPDYGPAVMHEKAGATVIGARDFLIAYNVNLNTKSTRLANSIAFDIRENGRVKRKGNPITGEIELDASGEPVRIPGLLRECKAIGWFIEEYDVAQVSINLTNYNVTSVHQCFDACCESALKRGLRVTGSELVGLIPLKALTDAGDHYLKKQGRSEGVSEREKIHIAVKSLGLDDLAPFDPNKKIIEYVMRGNTTSLVSMRLNDFTDETASESPAPGGGSISAAVGALGAALGTMVANLSAGKRGWEEKVSEFGAWAGQGQTFKDRLLFLVDEDTASFNAVMAAYALPKNTDEEKQARTSAIEKANIYATKIPLDVMKTAHDALPLILAMATLGNPNSISDAGVGALCLSTAVEGAYMNVKINAKGLKDRATADNFLAEAKQISTTTQTKVKEILKVVHEKL
jgi:glutamate formiminotransferase/formiminotetrahydrofolate cyclodeaminase